MEKIPFIDTSKPTPEQNDEVKNKKESKPNWIQRNAKNLAAGIALTAATIGGAPQNADAQFSGGSDHSNKNENYQNSYEHYESSREIKDSSGFEFTVKGRISFTDSKGTTYRTEEIWYKNQQLHLSRQDFGLLYEIKSAIVQKHGEYEVLTVSAKFLTATPAEDMEKKFVYDALQEKFIELQKNSPLYQKVIGN